MDNVIVVFPKATDGQNIKKLLVHNGIVVDAVCTSGSQALENINRLNGGIVVCSYKFTDMYYTELNELMPENFEMLLIASQGKCMDEDSGNIMKLELPVKSFDLINTVQMMFEAQTRRRRKMRLQPRVRSDEEKDIILKAKYVLMDRNSFTEEQAHRYLQKCSMDSGNSLVETANMVICLYRGNI